MASQGNPTWSRDELVLALDLYLRFEGNPPGKGSAEVIELSETLNLMAAAMSGRSATFRNPNGVYMKMMNFRPFDPRYKAGLSRGGRGDQEVWEELAHDPARVSRIAMAIVENLLDGEPVDDREVELDAIEAAEGRILTRVHRQRERSPELVRKKKAAAMKRDGALLCEACGFDFKAGYGPHGEGYIEAHHLQPLHTLSPGTKTKLEDLALLCANCHRMVHAKREWLTLDQLRELLTCARKA